jgi:ribosomal protein S12 methylthiotransferase accessory factor
MSTGTIAAPHAQARLVGLRRHLWAEVVAGEAAYLFSESGVTALTGAHVEQLVPLLDGTRDLPSLLREMPAGTVPGQVEALVTRLIQAGLANLWPQAQIVADERSLAYWDAGGLDPAAAVAAIAGARLALIAVGNVDSAATTAALSDAGLSVTPGQDETADLSVVLCEDYLAADLADIDAAHRAAGRPWLLAKPGGATVWIGPVFQPRQACWHCLSARLTAHRQAERYVQAALGRSGPAPRCAVSVQPLAAAAAHLVALEAAKWLAGYRYGDQQSIWTFDSFDLRGRHHELRVRPQCTACGDPTLMRTTAGYPVILASRPKTSRTGGGHRSTTPEQVLDRYRHLVSPITGVIREIERDRRGPSFFSTFRSGPNPVAGARSLRGLKSALRTENSGKGTTALQAEVGALCEALERHSGHLQGDEERVRGSLRSLGGEAIHPNTCQLFHERQYADRTTWNAGHSAFQYVSAPLEENAVLDWTPVWSLTEMRHRLLPTSMLYFGAHNTPGARYACADSNGNAAGSSLEDAVLQGLLELVERDAVALWWYNRTTAPGVDLGAFADPWIDEMREVYAGLGREVWALDLTSDLRIPAMVALSRRTTGDSEGIMFGFGSHPDPQVALLRALTELNQLLPAVVTAGPNGHYGWDDDPDAAYWLRHASIANQPYLVPDPAVRPRRPADYGYVPCPDLADDVDLIRTRLEDLGLEMLVLNQTRPDIGLPVVKVIVPGLRHFWARLGPGRLYDVPVALGRLPERTSYDQLNPVPLFA